jgi:hypothetical protein
MALDFEIESKEGDLPNSQTLISQERRDLMRLINPGKPRL